MKTLPVTCLVLLASLSTWAQSLPVLEQNPFSLRWYQVKTPHFRMLYPEGLDTTAQRTIQRLESLYEPVSATLGRKPRPISVVLQNQTTGSNGFVTLYPRRSEFFAVPPQDPGLLGTYNWLDLLAVHEFRHVVQYDKALQGYGRVLYTLLGNAGLFFPVITVPDWFAEGDAVGTETVLSTSGRGRIPNFDLGMRANLLAGRRFDYPKAVGGSYRDNVPNHYVLGYFLTTYLKREYGPDVWGRVLDRNYRRFPWPFAFSASIKNETGLRTEDLYQKAMDDLTEVWKQQQASLTVTPATNFPVRAEQQNSRRPVFTNYQHPQFLTDSTVVCVKSGLGDTPRLVILDRNGREQPLFVQGFPNDPDMLSAKNNTVFWIEFGYDPRWGQRVYSNVQRLDVSSGQYTHLTKKTRYTAVAVSPDTSRLVVVENTTGYKTRLCILNARTGKLLKVLPNPDNEFYLHPRWRDNQTVVTVALRDRQKTIQSIDVATGKQTDLLPRANENISHPQPWGNYVLYNSPRSGIDNIYAVDVRSKQIFQVTSRPLAAYHAAVSPSGAKLAFDDFNATGYRIADMTLTPDTWKPVSGSPSRRDQTQPVQFFGKLPQLDPVAAQGRRILADSVPATKSLVARRFNRLAHALNVYSWGPVVGSTGQALSVGLNSQDILGTTQLSVGYGYNQAERVGNFFANLSYQALYPIIDLSFQHGNRSTSIYIDRDQRGPLDSLRMDQWQYNQLTAGIRLPLNLTNSKYRQSMNLSAYYNYIHITGYDLPRRYITDVGFAGSLNALTYGFNYSRLLRMSSRDLLYRWGQTIAVTYRTTPFGGRLSAQQLGIQANLFFPGFAKHHSIRLRGGYQQQRATDTYRFSPLIFYPRGQSYVSDNEILAGSAEYHFPVADTHWSLGRFVYVQRIKASAFFDAANGQSVLPTAPTTSRYQQSYQTTGLNVSFIFNALRLRTPFEVGARFIYNVTTRQPLIQPLVVDIGF
jgi:hypothetical protein